MSASVWGQTPRQSIASACQRHGAEIVVQACVDLLHLRVVDPALVCALGGPRADLTSDHPGTAYWLRVWALRGLLWNWDPSASAEVCVALTDDAWRVREMAAKVVARHLVTDALPAVAEARFDTHARVRAAAHRAVARLTDAGA